MGVGGKNQKFMASISDFSQASGKVDGEGAVAPPAHPWINALKHVRSHFWYFLLIVLNMKDLYPMKFKQNIGYKRNMLFKFTQLFPQLEICFEL